MDRKDLMLSDMRSRLLDSEKPLFVRGCKKFESCESRIHSNCQGCNVWNYLYDIKSLQNGAKITMNALCISQ